MNPQHIIESDWKRLSKLKPLALDRLCERILAEIQQACSAPAQSHHERYLKVFALVQERDNDVADAFNDVRRSTALRRLTEMCWLDLLTPEEFSGFTEETRRDVEGILHFRAGK